MKFIFQHDCQHSRYVCTTLNTNSRWLPVQGSVQITELACALSTLDSASQGSHTYIVFKYLVIPFHWKNWHLIWHLSQLICLHWITKEHLLQLIVVNKNSLDHNQYDSRVHYVMCHIQLHKYHTKEHWFVEKRLGPSSVEIYKNSIIINSFVSTWIPTMLLSIFILPYSLFCKARNDREDCSSHLPGAAVEVFELLNQVSGAVTSVPWVVHHLNVFGRPTFNGFVHNLDQIPFLQVSFNTFNEGQNGFHLILHCQQKIV